MGTELDSVRKARKSVNKTEQRSTRVSSEARVFLIIPLVRVAIQSRRCLP